MRVKRSYNSIQVWLSARDTYNWATRPGAVWPCSFLSDKPVYAEFDQFRNLVDLKINYGKGEQDCPSDELNAMMDDLIWNK